MVAEIIGWEFFVVIGLVVLLFGGSQLPKLARSLGSAKTEFEKGLREGAERAKENDDKAAGKTDDKADDKPAT
jgi:sec-independent protein translocase protein TatA